MKYLIAVDKWKGCLTAAEVARAIAEGICARDPKASITALPLSDGGDGLLEAIAPYVKGHVMYTTVSDPLGRPICAPWILSERIAYKVSYKTAYIEMAKASGLALLRPDEYDPLNASSYGTGQLIAAALQHGARQVVVGLGGSATSDCGRGMLEALGFFNDDPDKEYDPYKWDWLYRTTFAMLSDVDNPLLGSNGAAAVFAPQKGATPEMVEQIEERNREMVEIGHHFHYNFHTYHDYSRRPGAGAAGGMGFAMMKFLRARKYNGAEYMLRLAGYDRLLKDSDVVITSEGCADAQTVMGKLPGAVLRKAQGKPVYLLAGSVRDQDQLQQAGFHCLPAASPADMPLAEAMRPEVARQNIRQALTNLPL